mgnify:CR=1 FL=1
MRSNVIKLFFVAILSLCIVGLYSINKKAMAGNNQGTSWASGFIDDGSSDDSNSDDKSSDDSSGGNKKKKPKKHWKTDGNANIDSSQNFLGTTDPADLVIKTDSDEKMRVTTDGNVGIGTDTPTGTLHVEGGSAIGVTDGNDITLNAQDGGPTGGAGGNIFLVPGASGDGFAPAGMVIIGTDDTILSLDVNGMIRIRGGTPWAGRILTATDSNGNAVWRDIDVNDDDSDPTNELQTLSQSGNNVTLSDNGGTVSVADNDDDSANELQSLSRTGTDVSLTNGGGTVSVADNDNDPTNEIQTLSLDNMTPTLSISNSNSVDLTSVQDGIGTDDQNLEGASLTGTSLQIDIENGDSTTVDLESLVGTDDQTLSFDGTDLSIEDGNSVDLSGIGKDNLGDHTATQNLSLMSFWLSGDGGDEGISIDSDGNIGIGTTEPDDLLSLGKGGRLRTETTLGNTLILGPYSGNPSQLMIVADMDLPIGVTSGNIGLSSNDVGVYGMRIGETNIPGADGFLVGGNPSNPFQIDFMVDRVTGNVGIGTTNPEENLEIYELNVPAIQLRDSTGRHKIYSTGFSPGGLKIASDSSIFFEPNNSRKYVMNAGKMGINTIDPGLHHLRVVASNTHSGSAAIKAEHTSTATGNTVYGVHSTATTNQINIGGFFSATGGVKNYGLIVEDGNVGIGETNPLSLLTLKGSTGTFNGVTYFNEDSPGTGVTLGEGYYDKLGVMGNFNPGVPGSIYLSAANVNSTNSSLIEVNNLAAGYGIDMNAGGFNTGGDIAFRTWNGIAGNSSSSVRMIIEDTTGNIGIGAMASATDKLTVAGNIVPSVTNTHSLGTADNVWRDVYVGNNSLHIGGRKLSSNEDGGLSWDNKLLGGTTWSTSGTSVYYNGGSIGIGTDNPQSPLHIQRSVNAGTNVENHVVIIENTKNGNNTNGLAIKLNNNNVVNNSNNYITFYNNTSYPVTNTNIAGRIEGQNLNDIDQIVNVSNTIKSYFDNAVANGMLEYDLGIEYNQNFFDPGKFPDISLTGSRSPSAEWDSGRPARFTNGNGVCDGSVPGGSSEGREFCIAGFELNYYFGKSPWLDFDPGSPGWIKIANGKLPSISTPLFSSVRAPSFSVDFPKVLTFMRDVAPIAAVDGMSAVAKYWRRRFHDPVGAAIKDSMVSLQGGGVTYESGSGDYAEWLERIDTEEEMQFGDIVGVFGGKISKKTDNADQVMVVSHKPIVLGNMPAKGKESLYEKVAFMGQVPVKVIGRTRKGDYIIPSGLGDGIGKAVSPEEMSTDLFAQVIGVSWGESDIKGLKYIKIAVGLKPVEFAKVVKGQSKKIAILENELETVTNELKSENDQLKEKLAALTDRQKALENMLLALSTDLPKEKLAMMNKIDKK